MTPYYKNRINNGNAGQNGSQPSRNVSKPARNGCRSKRNERRNDGKTGSHDREQPRKMDANLKEIRASQENPKEKMEANRESNTEFQESEELTKYGDIFAMDCNDCGWTDRLYHHRDIGEA